MVFSGQNKDSPSEILGKTLEKLVKNRDNFRSIKGQYFLKTDNDLLSALVPVSQLSELLLGTLAI